MPAFHKLQLNFNAGELSPFLVSRTDVQKYESGCQLLENFIILPYGGVIRRPGTQWLGEAKYSGDSVFESPVRLIGFNFSVTTNFILEVGWEYIRFWTNGIQVQFPHILDAEPAAWITATAYVEGDYVRRGSVPYTKYRCTEAHTSTVFADNLTAGWWVDVTPTVLPSWVTAHAYAVGDQVVQSNKDYECLIAHTSGTFNTDKNNGKWKQIFRVAGGNPLEINTPYQPEDLQGIQYCQINDIMYWVHPKYPPHKLTRHADDAWTFEALDFKWPPLLDENIKNITITPSGTSGDITLTALSTTENPEIFTEDDVGSTWQIGHNLAGANQSWAECPLGATSTTSGAIRVRGPWSLISYGTWSGEINLVRTIYRTNVTETIRTYHATADGQRNISTTGTEDEDCVMYITFTTAGSAGSSTPIARLELSGSKVYGLVKITGFANTQNLFGTVTWGLARAEATTYWSKAAFSKEQGHPRTVCLHEQRLIYGGTKKKPLAFWGSEIDDYENFQRGVAADAGFMFNIAANESNPINWMVSQTKLLLGTAGGEWAAGPAKDDEAMGAGNVQVTQQSSFGSAYLQARVVNEVVLFAQRQSRKIRELTFSFEKDGWVAPDLCILASHISGKGFVEMAFCQQPDAILWTITKDGNLVGMTYERDQNVVGWHRHSTDGTFESVASIYGGDDADEVWFSVKRTINGQTVRYIERFDPNFRTTFEDETKDHYWYLDCAFRSGNVSEVTTVTGLGHLEGKTCGILGDGANQPERTVTGGSVTIQEPAKLILIGLPYRSLVRPMNLNIPNADTMQGRSVRIHQMVLRLHKSLTCKFSSDDGASWDEVYFRDRTDHMDSSPKIFTGDKEVSTGAGFSTQQAMTVLQDRPFPLCILAEILWVNFYGH